MNKRVFFSYFIYFYPEIGIYRFIDIPQFSNDYGSSVLEYKYCKKDANQFSVI